MTGFMLNNGDLSITDGEIDAVENGELTAQTIQSVLSTNKGEWFFDEEEGINFDNIRGKNINEDVIKSEVVQAVAQVDDTLTVDDFDTDYDSTNRALKVKFSANYTSGESVEVNNKW